VLRSATRGRNKCADLALLRRPRCDWKREIV